MASRSSFPLALLPLALLAACGSRSQLAETSGSSAGSGGSGPTSSSASVSSGGGEGGLGGNGGSGGLGGNGGSGGGIGGSGGSGGTMITDCVLDGPPIGLAGTQGYSLSEPVLTGAGVNDLTTLVLGWTADKGPTPIPTEIRHTSFKPWGAWPADGTLAPSFLASYEGGESFSAARSSAGFALFHALSSDVPESDDGLYYTPGFLPGSGDIKVSKQIHSGQGRVRLFLSGSSPSRHMMGYTFIGAQSEVLSLAFQNDATSALVDHSNVVCAQDAIAAAAVPLGDQFLAVFSSGSSYGSPACWNGGGGVTIANRLNIVGFDGNGQSSPTTSINDGGSSIGAIKMVAHNDSAWVAWTRVSGGGPSPISVARVDKFGLMVFGPLLLPYSGDPWSLAAADLGGHLALAWASSAAETPASVQVIVFGDDASITAKATIPIGAPTSARLTLLGSPSGKALIVGWSEGKYPSAKARVARLACSLL